MPSRRGRAQHGSHRLSDDEYEALLVAQGGHCAICPSTPKTRRLHTDRDHTTGKVRGLLCYRCNAVLREYVDAAWLLRAYSYLQNVNITSLKVWPKGDA